MKKKSFLIICCLFLLSCYSGKINPNKRCNSALENNYQRIIYGNSISFTDNDENIFSEIRFECTIGPKYIEKRMFEKFGAWTRSIKLKNNYHKILIWENIKLFDDEDTLYNIAANGHESKKTIYTSVMISDANNNDLLKEDSPKRQKLVKYFSDLIRIKNSKEK